MLIPRCSASGWLIYPKGWSIYQVKGEDTALDSLLMIPTQAANKYITTSSEKMLSGSQLYSIEESVKKNKDQMIKVAGGVLYSKSVLPEDQKTYLQSLVDRQNKFGKNAKVIIYKGAPAMYVDSDISEDNVTTKEVSVEWFIKSNPKVPQNETPPILVGVTYIAPPDIFSQAILSGVVDSLEDHILEIYIKDKLTHQSATPDSNSQVESDLGSLRSLGEQVFINDRSYVNMCKNGILNEDIGYLKSVALNIIRLLSPDPKKASTQQSVGVVCYSSKKSWATSIKLAPNADGHLSFCVSSDGTASVDKSANKNIQTCTQ